MKYFIDTEFRESPNTIDLISIGVVCEDGREYYAVSKDFDIKAAWNSYDYTLQDFYGVHKVYWLRKNVLKAIYLELYDKYEEEVRIALYRNVYLKLLPKNFTYRNFKKLINKFGKTNKQIAEEIKEFCYYSYSEAQIENADIQFYGYYADYDHVCLSWLYGRMIDLPKGFPQYTKDIQQMIDDNNIDKELLLEEVPQVNCHNSLEDARWNMKLYNFITIK